MEKFKVLLNAKKRGGERRKRRRDLSQFLEVVVLFLEVGADFASAWDRALEQVGATVEGLFSVDPNSSDVSSFSSKLDYLARTYPDPGHRLWFQVFSELYSAGAPMKDVVLSAAEFLRKEHGREVELHCQSFPRRAQIYLLLFFLPPAFFLLFAPVLMQLTRPW